MINPISKIDLDELDTSQIYDISDMFKDCTSLTSIDFGNQNDPLNQIMVWRYKDSGCCKYNNDILLEFGDDTELRDKVETVTVLTEDFEYYEELKTQFPELFI